MKNLKKLLLLAALTLSAATAAAQDPETDWANFGRFEAENAALASSPEVVLMGNSITEGVDPPPSRLLRRERLREPRHQRPDHLADARALPRRRRGACTRGSW